MAAEAVLVQDGVAIDDEGQDGRRVSRRALLQAALIGGAGIAALPLLVLISKITKERPKPVNFIYPLNTDWLFGGVYRPGAESAGFDDSGFSPVTLPHTAATANSNAANANATNLSWRYWNPAVWQQVWIYRRRFDSAALPGKGKDGNKNRVFADFDGVMVNATVVCNDRVIATHQGGYLPFSAELTGALTNKDNVLSVIVDSHCLPVPPMGVGNSPASVDFLQPGGIYRDVSLRVVPQVFISDLYAAPADVLTSQPRVDVQCTIDAAQSAKGTSTLLVELLEDETSTNALTSKTLTLSIAEPGASTASLSLTGVWPVQLWSPDRPKLYTVRATLSVPGTGTHVMTKRIGFRDATFKTGGFYLNGTRLQLFGLNRHQLFPYTGMAMPARAHRKDAEIIRNEFNCNIVRCSHYPQSPHFLDACDELGLMVWEEAPGWDHVSPNTAWQNLVIQNVKDMVIRDRSRPSVIVWGTRLNETPDVPGLWAATRRAALELDPSRPSSGAMDVHDTRAWAEDVFAFNDYSYTRLTDYAALFPPLPGVPYLITESVGVVETKPQHFSWNDPPAVLAKQASLHAQAHNAARSNTSYAGMIAWAGFDYHSLRGSRPENIKWAGVADGFRIPKPGAAIYQAQLDPKVRPVIVPVFFWGLGGAQPAGQLMIASNCEQLQIAIEGERVITALPAANSPLYRNLPYPPFLVTLPATTPPPPAKPAKPAKNHPAPKIPAAKVTLPKDLVIRGFVGGAQVAEVRMSADPRLDHLTMAADDDTIVADGTDATRVVFRAVDAYGNQRRYPAGQLTFTVTGPGTLIGDNPFAFGAYGGLGAVWVRSVAGQRGTISVAAAHPALGRASVQLQSA
jgi:beta-galactosidase